jgi:hypothetical protein
MERRRHKLIGAKRAHEVGIQAGMGLNDGVNLFVKTRRDCLQNFLEQLGRWPRAKRVNARARMPQA